MGHYKGAQLEPKVVDLDEAQGASEERTEPYLNTVMVYRSWQRSDSPKASAELLALLAGRLMRSKNLGTNGRSSFEQL